MIAKKFQVFWAHFLQIQPYILKRGHSCWSETSAKSSLKAEVIAFQTLARFTTWPASKPAAGFEAGQPASKPVDPIYD